MKVYVLVESWQFDDGDCGEEICVYSNLDSARTQFRFLMNQATENLHNYVRDTYHDGDLSWCIYEEGNYAVNHYNITIYIRDVK